ncbi:MAG: hypothetical protein MUD12_14900 [Spirochaetes bacterium]|jgi:hypothetical protein|nr:hypothetical protein [Spirochaetota bacterium]
MPQYINFENIKFPDNIYVHKTRRENVHIYNLRRSIPRIIEDKIFEKHIIPVLEEEEKEFILNYYIKKNMNLYGIGSETEFSYVLRTLPVNISIKDMNEFFIEESVGEDDKKFLLQFYSMDQHGDHYILSKVFNELDELRIAKILKSRILFITDAEKARISEIFERIDKVHKEDVFIANMHVDPDHEYFFEHKLDHIPGMMMIETARQLFVACAHIYGKVPTSGIFFTLNRMDVSFREYLWLSYPIRLELRMTETNYNDEGYWFKCSCNVSFCQEHREKGGIGISGMTFKMDSLEAIIIKKQVNDALKFNYNPGLKCEIMLKDLKSEERLIGNVADISPKHFIVEFIEPVDFGKASEFEFRMNLEKHFEVRGTCVLKIHRKSGKRCMASFVIGRVDEAGGKNISEIIKRLCHAREQRGIL